MGGSFRKQPAPTLYPANKTPCTTDGLEIAFAVACAMIAFSFILIIAGIRGWERIWATVRVITALWIGLVLLECNFGYGWYVDKMKGVHTKYKAFSKVDITADIGLYIGLRGINVTLKGVPEYQHNEHIFYNEAFRWADPWVQGHIGFGPDAGQFNQEFRAKKVNGVPYPIQWVAGYFTVDEGQMRWGRKFRLAGWITHILLWLAFAVYLVTIILFWLVVRLGAIAMVLLGAIMILAVFFYGIIIMNDPELVIPFNAEDRLHPTFGSSFYFSLFTGFFCIFIGCLIWALDFFAPQKTAVMFNHTAAEFCQEESHLEQPEYGTSSFGVCRTERGVTVFRQSLRKRRHTIRLSTQSGRSTRSGSQNFMYNNNNIIPLEDIAQVTEVTVHVD